MMMNRLIASAIAPCFVFLACGCATTGYQRAAQARSTIANARAVTVDIQQNVETASRSLQVLTGPEATELRPLYQRLSAAINSLEAQTGRLSNLAQAFRKKSDVYIQAWQEELARYQSPAIRDLSAERRNAVIESLKRVTEQFKIAEESMQPLRVDLKDMRRYLGTDLTSGGVASAQEVARRITNQAAEVQQRLQSLLAELDRVATELAPVKPATETPAVPQPQEESQ